VGIIIRPLSYADGGVYKQVRLAALRDSPTAFSSSFETASLAPDSYFAERADFQADNFTLGAFSADTLVGTSGGIVEPETKRKHIGHIVGMWVRPDHRRQGIARSLLGRTIEQLRQVPDITTLQITVTASNTAAHALYTDVGFQEWGLEPRALFTTGNYHDDIHMIMLIH